MTIHVFTDSGADLPPSLASELAIHVVPLTIHFGDTQYKDSVELTTAEFYAKLQSSSESPNTSQPSPGEFLSAYQKHSNPGDTIFSFHLSSKLSGTYQSAVLAAKQLTDRSIHVIDTKSASMGIAVAAIFAARWAEQNMTPNDILANSQAIVAKTHIYFVVDTLEYLRRHGRIGKAQALVGSLLNIKPVLCLEDGVVTPADKVRGKTRAMGRLLELAFQHVKKDKQSVFAVLDTDGSETASGIVQAVHERVPNTEVFRSILGPTVGTHAGPGTIGLIVVELP
jgi:DegV family protein with EDD domain